MFWHLGFSTLVKIPQSYIVWIVKKLADLFFPQSISIIQKKVRIQSQLLWLAKLTQSYHRFKKMPDWITVYLIIVYFQIDNDAWWSPLKFSRLGISERPSASLSCHTVQKVWSQSFEGARYRLLHYWIVAKFSTPVTVWISIGNLRSQWVSLALDHRPGLNS